MDARADGPGGAEHVRLYEAREEAVQLLGLLSYQQEVETAMAMPCQTVHMRRHGLARGALRQGVVTLSQSNTAPSGRLCLSSKRSRR